jgi:hypothetical protein
VIAAGPAGKFGQRSQSYVGKWALCMVIDQDGSMRFYRDAERWLSWSV